MLQFHPHMRLDIADVIGHPWLANGEIADTDTVRAELARRNEMKNQRAIEQQRKFAKWVCKGVYKMDPYEHFLFFRGLSNVIYLTENEELEHYNGKIVRPELKKYYSNQHSQYSFFTDLCPGFILHLLHNCGIIASERPDSDKTWTINKEVTKTHDKPFIMEQAQIKIEILQVPG